MLSSREKPIFVLTPGVRTSDNHMVWAGWKLSLIAAVFFCQLWSRGRQMSTTKVGESDESMQDRVNSGDSERPRQRTLPSGNWIGEGVRADCRQCVDEGCVGSDGIGSKVNESYSNNDCTASTEALSQRSNATLEKDWAVRRVVSIHGLFEMTANECRSEPGDGKVELDAASLAIHHVNEQHFIPGYQLEMYTDDTMCDSGVAVDAFFRAIYKRPRMTAVLGTASSEVTERLTRIVSHLNVVQISFGATSPALSDQDNFPLFYRTVTPDSAHNAARLAFVQNFGWDTVVILHEEEDTFTLPVNDLTSGLDNANISFSTAGVTDQDYKEHLQKLKEKDHRIIIGSFSWRLGRKIFCEVYHRGMFGADYVWILPSSTADKFWWEEASDAPCLSSHISHAMLGVFFVGSHLSTVRNTTSISGLTTEEFYTALGDSGRGFPTQAYDAVWAVALALKKAINGRKENVMSIESFSSGRKEMARHLADTVAGLRFVGVSGPVSFQGSDRVGISNFHQNQGGALKLVALYHPHSSHLDLSCLGCAPLLWQGGVVPLARRVFRVRVATVPRAAFLTMTVLALLGIAMAVWFLAFNLHYRRLRYIKLSSPNLNNMTAVGCLLVYIAIILLGTDHGTLIPDLQFSHVCTARAFLLSGGFSLAFGSIFAKTFRVHQIFMRANSGLVKSKMLQDKQLIVLVVVLVIIDSVLITVWVVIDPMERHLSNLTLEVRRDVVYLPQKEQCNSAHMPQWLGMLYIYKGLLLAVGCYMAWETRHVKIPALNESQYIGMTVYNVVITSVLVVALSNIISTDRYALTFILMTVMIFLSTSLTLCLLFIPKIHTVLKNPDGDTIVASSGMKLECNTRRFVTDERREQLYRTEVQNRVFRRQLSQLEQELAKMRGVKETADFSSCVVQDVSDDEGFDKVDARDSPNSCLLQKKKNMPSGSDVRRISPPTFSVATASSSASSRLAGSFRRFTGPIGSGSRLAKVREDALCEVHTNVPALSSRDEDTSLLQRDSDHTQLDQEDVEEEEENEELCERILVLCDSGSFSPVIMRIRGESLARLFGFQDPTADDPSSS